MDKSKFSFQSLPEIIVASHREVIPNYAALGPLCVEKIGPEMQRLGCKCSAPGYCFTIEHNKEYRPTDIDIEYCEQVEEMGTDNTIIQFKHIDAVPMVKTSLGKVKLSLCIFLYFCFNSAQALLVNDKQAKPVCCP